MSNMKDIGFRLFGRNIIMDLNVDKDYNDCDYDCSSSSVGSKQGENRAQVEKTSKEEPNNTVKEEQKPLKTSKGCQSTITEDTKTAFNGKECSSHDSYNKHISDESSSTKSCTPQDRKQLKKPENIIPCPRCNSMATKFCYFNNYNVSQPRHFCKDCQRYWTAGGTMRNVPVGAGRRKNKNSSSSHNDSYGFLQANGDTNRVNFQGLPLQMPYMINHVALQSGFPVSFYATAQPDHCRTISNGLNPLLSRKHSRDSTGTTLFSDSDARIDNARGVRTKTSTVDDPIEAANSSIWTTLQLKSNRGNDSSIVKGGFFAGTRQFDINRANRVHEKGNDPSNTDLSKLLKLNPAAISRSFSFQGIR